MLMNTLERPSSGIALADRAPAGSIDEKERDRSGPARTAVDAFVARLLAAAEDTVAGSSYTAARRRILRQLELRGPSTVAGLGHGWSVTPKHLAHLVHELEQDGLVEPDGRFDGDPRVRLTADGRTAIAATRTLQLDLITTLLEATARKDSTLANATWRRLRAALDP
jgi:DNA-binding MarR family transcriptional regulator